MLRLCIAGVVFATCSYIGFHIAARYHARVRQLEYMLQVLQQLRREIAFYYTPFDTAIQNAVEGIDPCVASYVQDTAKYGLQSAPNPKLCLEQRERDVIASYLQRAGTGNIQVELSRLDGTVSAVEEVLRTAESNAKRYAKLYRALGPLMGLCFVILFI